LREITRVVATIDGFPLAGRSRDEIRAGLRSLTASPQVVFYRLKNDRPEIVRVLDGRQDIEEIFFRRLRAVTQQLRKRSGCTYAKMIGADSRATAPV